MHKLTKPVKFSNLSPICAYLMFSIFNAAPSLASTESDEEYFQRCQEYRQAMVILNNDIRLGYQDASLFELRGDVFRAMGELDQALADYQRASELRAFRVRRLQACSSQ